MRARIRAWSVGVGLAVLLGTGGGAAAAAPAGPRFDPTTTAVEAGTSGATVVRFTELGLQPDEGVDIAVTITVAVETSCVVPSSGQVLFSSSSSGSATTTKTRQADSAGRIVGVETLRAEAGSVSVTGMPCEMREKRTVSATIVDLVHNVSISVAS